MKITMQPLTFARIAALCLLTLVASPSLAGVEIQKVQSRSGITAWLVEDHDIPVIAVNIAFKGGSATDPANKAGLATLVSGLLDEGAGDMKSEDFQRRLEDHSIELSFRASRDTMNGSMRTLSKNRDEAFTLMGLALTSPRFDSAPVRRVRSQLLAMIARSDEQPEALASKSWYKLAFPGHPYGQPELGTPETLKAITTQDISEFARTHFARSNMIVGVVGDIDATTLSALLDETFGTLPIAAEVTQPTDVKAAPEPGIHVIQTSSPQSVVVFGAAGIKRRDPDWYVAYVMNYILGGGGLTSRLADEVREKRGLAYGVYTNLYPFDHSALFLGSVGTRNEKVAESIDIIGKEIARLRDQGVTEEELKNAITYLTGSYPLKFGSSEEIAGQLVLMQLEDFDTSYVNKRNSYIESVTVPQIQRVAKRLLKPEALSWVVVGDPKGLDATAAPALSKE